MLRRIRRLKRRDGVASSRVKAVDVHAAIKWTDMMSFRLFYGIIFTGVVSVVYAFRANATLSAMPKPMIRSEQFVLSVLIHYPLYLLWGVYLGVIALFILNLLVNLWLTRMMNKAQSLPDSGKTEVPHG
ncbi:TPA: hypothetical protein R8G72_004439 [Citrobacter youngae]|nr:hypothetical protein [Citrobacter youngae]HEF0074280.1 hypothetical protein [Citrobacter youngae]